MSQRGPRTNLSLSSTLETMPVKMETMFKTTNKIAGIKMNQRIFLTKAKLISAIMSGVELYLTAIKMVRANLYSGLPLNASPVK